MPAKKTNQALVLTKNLTRDLKRGHPWVYRNALDPKSLPSVSGFFELHDKKGGFLAFGAYDQGSDIGFRVLSLNRVPRPHELIFKRMADSLYCRQSLIRPSNNGFRWLHGEGDRLPGLVLDVFGETAVIQTDGLNLHDIYPIEDIAGQAMKLHNAIKSVVLKPQSGKGDAELVAGETRDRVVEFIENGVRWTADVFHGQKTGFFLDQRENREFIRGFAKNLEVLNLFSYTGGFSLAAGVGGARQVTSVDISRPAIKECEKHWILNDLEPDKHLGVAVNAFDFLQDEAKKYDLIIVDPPAFATSRSSLRSALSSYESIFSQAIKTVVSGGFVALSSCSRAVGFPEFEELVQRSLSLARRSGVVLHVSGQPSDHPYPHICPELRYLKFYFIKLDP